jgi:hypothetical protein
MGEKVPIFDLELQADNYKDDAIVMLEVIKPNWKSENITFKVSFKNNVLKTIYNPGNVASLLFNAPNDVKMCKIENKIILCYHYIYPACRHPA